MFEKWKIGLGREIEMTDESDEQMITSLNCGIQV